MNAPYLREILQASEAEAVNTFFSAGPTYVGAATRLADGSWRPPPLRRIDFGWTRQSDVADVE